MNRDRVQGHRVRERDPHIRRVRIPRVIHEFLQGLLGGPVRLTQQGSQARVHLEIRMSRLHGYSIRSEDTLWMLELYARAVNAFSKRLLGVTQARRRSVRPSSLGAEQTEYELV